MKTLFLILISMFLVFPVLSGCEKKVPPAKQTKTTVTEVQKAETKPEQVIQEEPEKKEETFTYDSKGKRDPFEPLYVVDKGEPKIRRTIGTIESYDITEFNLIAVAKKGNESYGLILAPDNKAFTAREGTILGLHKGKVIKVTSDKMVIKEFKKDYTGELKPFEVVLELHKGEGRE